MSQRASQTVAEALAKADVAQTNARASQVVSEALAEADLAQTDARASQIVSEALGQSATTARATQIVVELLVWNYAVPTPPVYPQLPGLGYSVIWEPRFVNAPVQTHESGTEVRIGYGENPLHNFELVYNFLKDTPGTIEFKTFFGFFLAVAGSLGGFCFPNPDDRSVERQDIATTDGSTNVWTLVRTFGAGGFTGTEPVGYVDITAPFNVYFDGVLQLGNTYEVIRTTPVSQQIRFFNTPGAGKKLSVDMSYFYYCRFADDKLTFEKFLHQLWTVSSVKLMSLRR